MHQCTRNLIEKQKREFPNILDDLHENGRKTGHWAWYVWPTEKEGLSEPFPKSSIAPTDVELFLSQTDIEQWTLILRLISDLLEHAHSRSEIIPKIDHGRIEFFFLFWQRNSSLLEKHIDFRDAIIQFKAVFQEKDNFGYWTP